MEQAATSSSTRKRARSPEDSVNGQIKALREVRDFTPFDEIRCWEGENGGPPRERFERSTPSFSTRNCARLPNAQNRVEAIESSIPPSLAHWDAWRQVSSPPMTSSHTTTDADFGHMASSAISAISVTTDHQLSSGCSQELNLCAEPLPVKRAPERRSDLNCLGKRRKTMKSSPLRCVTFLEQQPGETQVDRNEI